MPEPAPKPLAALIAHIPPEDALLLALVALEAVAVLWQRKRASWSMHTLRLRRDVEFALEHEHGLGPLVKDLLPHRG